MSTTSTETNKEKVILVLLNTPSSEFDPEESLDELDELVKTAGADTVGRMVQNLDRVHPGTYIGKGKVQELKELIWETDATGIITDDELSPSQLANLNDELDCKVMDRTMLILDIFAARAHTREGMIQVELAQLKYNMHRLVGLGKSLSRQGGGIGSKGPGEKKLEMDRRLIRNTIAQLNKELKDVEKHRQLLREKRKAGHVPVVTLVGYTNAGKSTLLNSLTGAGVLAENKLFATLDPTTRLWTLPNGKEVILTDTVGFINKLPHHLTKAFHSTLEEAVYADLLLHVVDVANESAQMQLDVVHETLDGLGVADYPTITVFNKTDLQEPKIKPTHYTPEAMVNISALKGIGLDKLSQEVEEFFLKQSVEINEVIPYAKGHVIDLIRTKGQLINEEYVAEGTKVLGYVNQALYGQIRKILED